MASSGRPQTTKMDSAKIDSQIVDLYSFGWNQAEIAAELKLTQQAVSKRLKRLKKTWLAEIERPREELLAERLIELRRMEKMALEEYRKSAEPLVTTTVTTGGKPGPAREQLDDEAPLDKMRERLENIASGGKTSRGISRSRIGNPAFLKLAFDCKKLRTQLEGLAPKDSIEDKVNEALGQQWGEMFAYFEKELPADSIQELYLAISRFQEAQQ